MAENLRFETRADFRTWLSKNAETSGGVWLVFGKTKRVKTLKAGEALEEALCFGWIDGVMKKLDEDSYIKYFALRRKNSKWSEKNKKIVAKLEEQGLLTELGREKIAEAKENGQWENATRPSAITEGQIAEVSALLKGNAEASKNFENMPPSVRKTYTRAYFDAKTDAGRASRLAWMTDRLEKNLKPM
ncbi:YdeI/OmpD-associated family protein [Candidatus Enterococcus murrayae]|uniref:YdeI/OmpD-associated family protein n=1 Tax=Candidatus Enterococcus murrayae TaxID=2815321 RepID=A0ABS3HHW6_9ENTE|nr:YdeI/OmpD-associated family protein [Enterococcus sp. MJM16]MBO0453051.1 YdeI/OmpD-associated family protein [Enterococcus sp. MJM16]